jgi:hypothetical protein
MFEAAPDGTQKPILDSTALSIEVPANKGVSLSGTFDASWEQAAVIYVDGTMINEQIGSFNRPRFVLIGRKNTKQTVTVAGWHKRSPPSGGHPWVASRGKKVNETLKFDDSAGDEDFNDMLIKFAIE